MAIAAKTPTRLVRRWWRMMLMTLTRLVRRWWLIGLLTILGAFGGLGYGLMSDPVYTAKAYLIVVTGNPSDSTAVSYAQAYARIADQGAALNAAAAASNGTSSVDELRRQVRASASRDAPVIELTGSASSASRAADVANLVADGLVTTANRHTADTRMGLTVLSAAIPPTGPTSPRLGLSVAVGAAVGLLLGGLALLAETDRSGANRNQARSAIVGRRRAANGTAAPDVRRWTGRTPVTARMAPAARDKAEEPSLGRDNGQTDHGDRTGDGDTGNPDSSGNVGTQNRVDRGMARPDATPRQRPKQQARR